MNQIGGMISKGEQLSIFLSPPQSLIIIFMHSHLSLIVYTLRHIVCHLRCSMYRYDADMWVELVTIARSLEID